MPKATKAEKPTKTETLAIRLDPKTKYGLELISRKQRRSLTSVVEWLINESIRNELIVEERRQSTLFNGGVSWDYYFLDDIWDPDELIRLIKLIDFDKSFLNFEEELVWLTIRENAYYWYGEILEETYKWDSDDISALILERVRQDLPILREIATGRKSADDLEHYYKACTFGQGSSSERVFYFDKEVEWYRKFFGTAEEREEMKKKVMEKQAERKNAKSKGKES